MILAVNGSFIQVEESEVVYRVLPMNILGEIDDFGSRRLEIKPGNTKTVTEDSPVKGFFMNSDHIVNVRSSSPDTLAMRGSHIYQRGIRAASLTFSPEHKVLTSGVIEEVSTADGKHILKIVDGNYLYSKLYSDFILGPFNTEGYYLIVTLEGKGQMDVTFSDVLTLDEDGEVREPALVEETAQAVCDAFNRRVKEKFPVTQFIEMSYDSDTHMFCIKSNIAGALELETGNDQLSRQLAFVSSELVLGTEDFTGKRLVFNSGDSAGLYSTISDISEATITLSDMIDPAPSAGDVIAIVDTEAVCTIDLMLEL